MTRKLEIEYPSIAAMFFMPGHYDPTDQIIEWCEQNIADQYYELCGGDHEFEYDHTDLNPFDLDTHVRLIVFRSSQARVRFEDHFNSNTETGDA